MKTKKAQGISINTIIIAAIALIVLVIVIAVFAQKWTCWNDANCLNIETQVNKTKICYLEGTIGGSELSIRSSIDGKCAFPFTYTVNESDELYLTFRKE